MDQPLTNNLEALWMPFTANREFKAAPRLLAEAEGMYYRTPDGRTVLDGVAGLWCVNAGHCRPKIVEAIQRQAARMDYAPGFQMGHPLAFEHAARLATIAPGDLDRIFFVNSGSEAVETALKIAIAYHRLNGEGQRTRLIGRARGYHGVNIGGLSVSGVQGNRRMFGAVMVPGVDHLPHTHSIEHNAYSRGQPGWGAHLADALEDLVALHDASTIAAVIVEPIAGSAGVIMPPRGYLERLRAICDKYGILLILDEVITGFGRTGAPFAAERFGVVPDLLTVAKGITNGCVPMGAVFVKRAIYDAFMQGPEGAIEFAHGYTYSGHPLACAAGLATLEVYREEGLFERAAALEDYFADAVFQLKGLPHVIDIRTLGLVAGIELEPRPGAAGRRAFESFLRCFEAGVLVRFTGDIIALSPPLIVEREQIDRIVETIATALKAVA
jgi:beta-alanine--pyruvate transaminase